MPGMACASSIVWRIAHRNDTVSPSHVVAVASRSTSLIAWSHAARARAKNASTPSVVSPGSSSTSSLARASTARWAVRRSRTASSTRRLPRA